MFSVLVERVSPYVECLWYEEDTLEKAKELANDYCNLSGVDCVVIFDEKQQKICEVF